METKTIARDTQIFDLIKQEAHSQESGLELIASENFTSKQVLEAMGSVMTNKYAEGLPHKRYYGGCEFVDVAEEQALERVKQLFGADHANVQAHSGASANLAAYLAVSKPGDTLLGMSLAHGGHLTHGHPVSLADLVTSTTHKTLRGPRGGFVLSRAALSEKLDKTVFPGLQGGPLMHVIAAKAVCFGEALGDGFRLYARRVVENARTLAESLVERGLDLVSGGTDNHLMLVDLRRRGLTGKAAEEALQRARITVNKNAVPN